MVTLFHSLSKRWQATVLMSLAMLFFSLMSVFIRLSAETVPVMEVVFFRNLLAAFVLVPFVLRKGSAGLRMNRPGLFFLRGGVNIIGMTAGFTAVTMIPLAEMMALSFTTPLFVTLGAVLFLGEVIRIRRIIAICIGFGGALIILQPGFSTVSTGAMLALVSALTIALASLVVKRMTETEHPDSIVTWMVLMQTPLALVPALTVWQWPEGISWVYLWAMAITGSIAHACWTRACGLVQINSLQPLEFLKLVFAVLLGWFVFAELPGIWVWLGAAVISLSTIYITHREARAAQSIRPNDGLRETKL